MKSTFKFFSKVLGYDLKNILRINYKPEDEKENITLSQLHHIHIIDRSGSMSSNIDQLIEDIKITLKFIPEDDYITVIWFSGEGQVGTVIKCVKKSGNIEYINNLLDTIKSTIGCTYFTQAFNEVKNIIKETKSICENYNITLFTDGASCCNNEKLDVKTSLEIVNEIKDKVISLNCIGYGYYYDKEFLTKLSELTMFGRFNHSSNITDYSVYFKHNYERINDLLMDKINIRVSCADAYILYISSKNTKLTMSNSIEISRINKTKNQFFIILPRDIELNNIEVFINDNSVEFPKNVKNKENPSTINNFMYALAYENYYKGNRQFALDLLGNVCDKKLIDELLKAFSYDEVEKFTKLLRKSIFDNSVRATDTCPPNYIPSNDAYCLMDLIKDLAKDNCYYIPDTKNYNRIGRKVTDSFNLFKSDNQPIYANFNDLVFNKDKLNLSIRFTINGTVDINPRQAERYNLPKTVNSKLYNNHTIIKDGNLNITQLNICVPSKEYFDYYLRYSSKDSINDEIVVDGKSYYTLTLDLTRLPIINRIYLNQSSDLDLITKYVTKNFKLEVKQKVINYLIDELYKNDPSNYKEAQFTSFSEDQIEVLKEHGLDKNFNYVGVNRVTSEKNENDFYMARSLSFSLKGCSSIPSIKSGLEKYEQNKEKNKESNFATTLIKEYHDMYKDDDKESLYKELKETKSQLLEFRNILSTYKIAKVLTGSWWENLEVDNKGNYTYYCEDVLQTLIIKTNYSKEYF